MNTSTIKNELVERLKEYQSVFCNNIIEYSPFIVEVGALTVGTDENGKVIAKNALYPMQFSKKAVETILTINWKNGDGNKVMPLVFHRKDWYGKQIQLIEQTLEMLQPIDEC